MMQIKNVALRCLLYVSICASFFSLAYKPAEAQLGMPISTGPIIWVGIAKNSAGSKTNVLIYFKDNYTKAEIGASDSTYGILDVKQTGANQFLMTGSVSNKNIDKTFDATANCNINQRAKPLELNCSYELVPKSVDINFGDLLLAEVGDFPGIVSGNLNVSRRVYTCSAVLNLSIYVTPGTTFPHLSNCGYLPH